VRTYGHDDKPYGDPSQIDLGLATKALAASMVSCTAVDDEQAWESSDQCPVVAQFEV